MKNGIIISDAAPIFSLALINQLELLDAFFDDIYIPNAVWEKITRDSSKSDYFTVYEFFKNKIKEINSSNQLQFVMDYGESEAIILYQETGANFLLIDDKKARAYAKNIGVNCVGTLGILIRAKEKKLLKELRPLFLRLLSNDRYSSKKLLNSILQRFEEASIS